MSASDWRLFRAIVVWGALIGLVYTAMDSGNYSERGRHYIPPQLAGCQYTLLGRVCRGTEHDRENDDSESYAREW